MNEPVTQCDVRSGSHFLAGAVFWRFHSLRVWSSEAVTRTGSTGWKARLRTESKWLRRVNLGFQVFLRASLLLVIWERGGGACIYNPCDDKAFNFTFSRI